MTSETMPSMLGKYEIEGILGRGAMGVVYRGFDPAIERTVAIKTVRTDLLIGADGTEWLERFKREARAAGRLLHPNIVAVFEYGEHDGTPFIAMEYVEGVELQDWFRDHPDVSLDGAVSCITQVLYGLEAAHRKEIVHRDVKPANIIMLEDGTVKVADFGIARIDSVQRTMPGSVAGTPTYMAPEQITGDPVDGRSDVFAVGVILYELMTGERPFAGRTATEVMYRVVNADARDPVEINGTITPGLAAVMTKALAKNPAERFQSAVEFADALQWAAYEAMQEAGEAAPEAVIAETHQPTPAAAEARPQQSALALLEEELAYYVGPVAKVMVKIAAQRAETPEALCENLALRIADGDARADFKERAYAVFGLDPAAPPAAPEPPPMVVHPRGVDAAQAPATGIVSPPKGVPAEVAAAVAASDAAREAAFVKARAKARRSRFTSGLTIVLVLGLCFGAYLYFVKPELLFATTRAARNTLGGGVMTVGPSATTSTPVALPPAMMSAESYESTLNLEMRREIQRGLAVLRFYSGPIDGDFGRATRNSIRAYQQALGQTGTGTLDSPLVQDLLNRTREQRRSTR